MNPMKRTAQNDPEWYRKYVQNRSGGRFFETRNSVCKVSPQFPKLKSWRGGAKTVFWTQTKNWKLPKSGPHPLNIHIIILLGAL